MMVRCKITPRLAQQNINVVERANAANGHAWQPFFMSAVGSGADISMGPLSAR